MPLSSSTFSGFPELDDALLRTSRLTRRLQDDLGDAGSWRKRDHTPVTLADLAGQAILLGAIAENAPGDEVLAEEEAASLDKKDRGARVRELVEQALGSSISLGEVRERIGYRGTPNGDARWLVDPIDGTKGYIRGLAYAVAVARLVKNRIERAWLGVPGAESVLPDVTGKLFIAARGRGVRTLAIEDGTEGRLPEHRPQPIEGGDLVIVASRAHETVDLPPTLDLERWPVQLLSLDSQAKYAALVAGAAHLYPRKPSHWIGPFYCWDHASGILLVEEAGGFCSDLAGNVPDWSRGKRMENNRGIFAASHPELHRRFQPLFAAHGLKHH